VWWVKALSGRTELRLRLVSRRTHGTDLPRLLAEEAPKAASSNKGKLHLGKPRGGP
jgi:hypothetical protein